MSVSPKARIEGLVTEWVDGELVVYDEVSQTAHCLSIVAASVWEHCDGRLSSSGIAERLGETSVAVEQALDELEACSLLDGVPAAGQSYSRRQAVTRIAQLGGAAFTAPLIYSVAIGTATAAASTCVANGSPESACTATAGHTAPDARCCSGQCYQTAIGATKLCAASGCHAAGLGCVVFGNACCSGVCFALFCT